MLWVKSFHIVAIVAWFAGIFYLPRLFVYHAESKDSISLERFVVMERRLYRGIMTPAGVLATALGAWLVMFNPSLYMKANWFHLKLGLVLLLWAYHIYCGYLRKQFAVGKNKFSSRFYRWFNEVSVVILMIIVILVTVKPNF